MEVESDSSDIQLLINEPNGNDELKSNENNKKLR